MVGTIAGVLVKIMEDLTHDFITESRKIAYSNI
jgi:hypothetical protein